MIWSIFSIGKFYIHPLFFFYNNIFLLYSSNIYIYLHIRHFYFLIHVISSPSTHIFQIFSPTYPNMLFLNNCYTLLLPPKLFLHLLCNPKCHIFLYEKTFICFFFFYKMKKTFICYQTSIQASIKASILNFCLKKSMIKF